MAAPTGTPLGQLGLLPVELRVRIYESAIISEGHLIRVNPDGELQQANSNHCHPLERMYTIQTVSTSIAREINGLHVPSRVCTFVVEQPRSLEALLTKTTCQISGICKLEIRSTYCVLCHHCSWERRAIRPASEEELALGRMSYSVWERAFEMLGPRVRLIRIDVANDISCINNRQSIRKRIVKLAAMAAKTTDGRARIRVEAGSLVRSEQRFLEEGVQGVVPKMLGWPYETFGGGCATEEQMKAEVAMVKEWLGLEGMNELMDENGGRGVGKVCDK